MTVSNRRLPVQPPPDVSRFFTPDRIRSLRESAGLSQADLADRLDMSSHKMVSNWEVDRKPPGRRSLIALWAWYRSLVSAGTVQDSYYSSE